MDRLKILIVDDHQPFLETLGEGLSLKGFLTLNVQDGRLALELAETHKPGLIICDVRMPRFDGYDVLITLGKNPVTRDIPVIMISGSWTDSNRRLAKELGAKDCLNKPCDFDDLIQVIRKYCL